MVPKLAIIVPTLNERGNISLVYERVKSILAHEAWELIFVDDDSSDGTCNAILEIAAKDSRVRMIQRINRKGLSSACIEGMLSSCAPMLAVMDADLQHDVTLLPLMLEALNDDGLDIAIGSRYMFGGGTGEWHPFRIFASRTATRLSKIFIKNNITDPMSGFFILRRTCFLQVVPSLSGRGFKILLDILTSNKKFCTKEFPYQFGKRTVGESKLDTLVGLEFFLLIVEKILGRFIPLNFLLFISVGSFGALLHLSILYVMLEDSYNFVSAQSSATFFAMTINFFLNNLTTYRSVRLKGKSVFIGLLSFYTICGVGAFTNVQVAAHLYELDVSWWGAGIIGAAIGAVWNYAVTSTFTWKLV
jgi:dolichol-phosphate mannosyltransferase